ncbi:cupin domain-containing protein [Paenibacillus sp. TRM 82003]|uniref:cupin domain-containing protein n=1 Tax=Kineococcus sp. TRM81007 TaxID=2925831 RepID=UPI001F5A509C|nr:cupin domain-containing protein [Kineococcus sp. TRM81007]MCI2237244.1 cupin domain-containing protein [Kineococcus sp. TRM81007]MCI3919793.1 cupin domain-containing protein [Paenibacillus sp. TRM 82003]
MDRSPVVRRFDEADEEVWSDERGKLSFRTLLGDGSTATRDLTSGVARLGPGGFLALHRHAVPEVYHVISGRGVVTLEGTEHDVHAGAGVYIPSDLVHGIRNAGKETLEFVFVYQVDAADQVEYVWVDPAQPALE